MSCEIRQIAFDAIRIASANGLQRCGVEEEIFKQDWAQSYLVEEKSLRQLRNRVGWCLDQLKTANLIENKRGKWFLTAHGLAQKNGIDGREVGLTVGAIESAMRK